MSSGMSIDKLLADFPDLDRDDINACLAFAAEREHHTVGVGSIGRRIAAMLRQRIDKKGLQP